MLARSCRWMVVVVLGISMLGMLQWNFQQKILDQVVQIQVAVAARADFIPPLFGGRHIDLRKHFILDHMGQAEEGFLLFVGDSIVEGINFPELGNKKVINGGIGGAGVSDVLDLLVRAQAAKPVSGVLIAIGVNDAIRSNVSEDFLITWENKYDQVINLAKQLSNNKVAVLTVLPVEKGKSLGDQYFSMDRIQFFNRTIATLAKKHGVLMVDQYTAFRPLYDANTPFTTDGVHLRASAYRLMKDILRQTVVGW